MTARLTSTQCIGLFVVICATSALASPHIPTSDTEVLEHLPSRTGFASPRTTRALHALVSKDPNNLDLALRLAQIHVARGRADSDPRQLGRAQAVLAPWWNEKEPPIPVLVLRATIEQSIHEFKNALSDLQQAITRDPANAQAWLTLAIVQQVTGDLAGATESCRRVSELSQSLVSVACKASIDGVSGNASVAYAALDRAVAMAQTGRTESIAVRTWAITMQAELAERLGRSDAADRLYRTSLALDASDAYTIAAYSDFLIDTNRSHEVLGLIVADTPVDTLLLRYAQAAARTRAPDASSSAKDLADRFAASRERGDRVHLREEARFTLEIEKSAQPALQLALDNWAIQKGPIDARIVLEAALAANQPQAASNVIQWVRASGLEDARITQLTQQVGEQ